MSKLTDALSNLRIHNNHNLMSKFGGAMDVWVEYTPTDEGRGGRWAHSSVHSLHFKTGTDSAWYTQGAKWFNGKRSASLPLALAWASENFGIKEWAASPFGGRIPAHALAAAKQAVKATT